MIQPVMKMLKKFLVLNLHHVKEAKKRRFQKGVVGSQKDEDNVLCLAFLNVSRDPITVTRRHLFI
jgi:hypothetical protein